MASNAEAGLSREGLIWLLAEQISRAENKPINKPGSTDFDRAYVLDLIHDVVVTVDGKRETIEGKGKKPMKVNPAASAGV